MIAEQRAFLSGLAAGLFLAVALAAVMLATVLRPPHCPMEDSCAYGYSAERGAYVQEVTP